MLGTEIHDPDGVEGVTGASARGLGLLPVTTTFAAEKALRLPSGEALGAAAGGYEIHHGRIIREPSADEFLGGARSGQVFGTMWHGSLEGDAFRAAFLREVAGLEPSGVSFPAARERRMEVLADLVEEYLDVEALLALARDGAPQSLPTLTVGERR